MPRTPLHVALGESGDSLTFEMIQKAVSEGIEERADLDWKSVLPLTASDKQAKEAQAMELAKDISAMANSGGGMIVYGVKERLGNTSAAGEIAPVGMFGETELRNIRQVANNYIYPPVTSLHLIPVAPSRDQAQGVLAALVLPSSDTPHLMHQKGNHEWFQAPWRDGSDTRRMSERQLADAYRQREQGRQQREHDFDKFYNDFVQSTGAVKNGLGEGANWVVGVAQPLQPRQDDRRLSGVGARRFLEAAQCYFNNEGISAFQELRNHDPRRGVKRFYFVSKRSIGSHSNLALLRDPSIRARIEIHGNGSFAIAFSRDGIFGNNDRRSGHVSTGDIEGLAKELIALILQATSSQSVLSDYQVRINVTPRTHSFLRPDPVLKGHFQPFSDEQRIINYQPIDSTIITQYGTEQLLRSAAEFLEDLNAQLGIWRTPTAEDLADEIDGNTR